MNQNCFLEIIIASKREITLVSKTETRKTEKKLSKNTTWKIYI